MERTKLTLSPRELEIASSADIILTKQKIIQTVYALFETQVPVINKCFNSSSNNWPNEITSATPKISKGENYLGLPYVMLDYPARFSSADVFALRTMFWWANYISVTLHLKGRYLEMFQQPLFSNLKRADNDFYIYNGSNEWEHNLESGNYKPLREIDKDHLGEMITKNNFAKVALRFPLQQWNEAEEILAKDVKKIVELLEH